MDKLVRGLKEGLKDTLTNQPNADVLLIGRIQRNETPNAEHLMHVNAVLVSTRNGEVLWTTSWRGAARISRSEWEFKKTALLICLAFAAGILIIYARQEDRKHAA